MRSAHIATPLADRSGALPRRPLADRSRRGRRNRPARRIGALFALVCAAATRAPQVAAAQIAQPPASTTASSSQARDTTAAGTLGIDPVAAGDRLVLRVWRETTWGGTFSVDAAGDVSLPRIGVLRVAGLAPLVVRDSVVRRLGRFLREPYIDLVVLRRVAVLGAVKKPDVFYVEPVTSVRDLIAQAGGIADDGNPNRVELIRGTQRIALGRWDGPNGAAETVRSGDRIVVARRGWLARNGVAAASSFAVAVSVLVSAFR